MILSEEKHVLNLLRTAGARRDAYEENTSTHSR